MSNYKVSASGLPIGEVQANQEQFQGRKVYKLVGDVSPEAVVIKTRSHWGIDDSGRRRLMRLASGASSVWLDEQKKNNEDSYRVDPIVIENGRHLVERGSLLEEFMDRSVLNQKNGGSRFYHYSPEELAEKKMDFEDAVVDVKVRIRNKMKKPEGIVEIANIAKGLKLGYHEGMTDKMLKELMYDASEKDPHKVLQSFTDKSVKALAYIDIAFGQGELIYDGSRVKWAGGEEIIKIPQGRPWKEYLAEYAIHFENTDFFKELDKVANK